MRIVRCDGSPEAVAVLTDALAAALAGGPPVLPVPAAAEHPVRPGPEPPAGTALVIETSGSTGAAKRVVLSAAAVRAAAEATHRRLGGPGRWLLALPAHHVAGAQVLMRAVLAGDRPTVLDTRAGFRPHRFALAATALRDAAEGARCYTSLVPTQLHRVLATATDGTDGTDETDGASGRDGADTALAALRRFDAVLVGGAAAPPALLAEARRAGVRAVTTYGMTETAGGCVYDGVPLDGTRVRLDQADGRIWLAGPMLATCYLGDPEATAEAFRGGWFRTSDLGRWDADGRLRVLGRDDEMIVSGGEKVHPAAVERVLAARPGVRAACVVGLADPEWGQLVAAAVECAAADQVDPVELAEAVRVELGAAAVPRLIRPLTELPVRGIGKPDRAEVARLLRQQLAR
jgi:o-succinylbenzoate---CoA ligase